MSGKNPARFNVYLLGFMGAGKSTVGSLLAEKLALKFIDTDQKIEKDLGLSVSEIFQTFGEVYFRQLEAKAIEDLSDLTGYVIALGGGALLSPTNRKLIASSGFRVYLKAQSSTLVRRILVTQQSRPILAGIIPSQLEEAVDQMMRSRSCFYEEADWVIDTDHKSALEVASELECLDWQTR